MNNKQLKTKVPGIKKRMLQSNNNNIKSRLSTQVVKELKQEKSYISHGF